MHGSFAVLFLLLALSSAQLEFECPKVEGQCVDGFYADPDDCTTYFSCVDCQYNFETCPGDFHFDPINRVCTEPSEARCDPIYYTVNGSAFCAISESSSSGMMDPFVFTDTLVNNRVPFNLVNNKFTAYRDGTYFFHLCAGTDEGDVDLSINDLPNATFANIIRNSSSPKNYDIDVLSRNVMTQLDENDTLTLHLEEGSDVFYSDPARQIVWAGFSLEEFMDQVVAFSAVQDDTFDTLGPVTFSRLVVDEGGDFDVNTGTFTAPVDGTYFFTYSAGVLAHRGQRVRFVQNAGWSSEYELAEHWRGLRNFDPLSFDTLSRSIMANMVAGDTMSLRLMSGALENTQDTLFAFSGFLYSPENSPKHAWSVSSRTAQLSPATPTSGTPLVYDEVPVNEGGLFDDQNNMVTTSVGGYYYISMSVGATDDAGVLVSLKADSDILAQFHRSQVVEQEPDNMARDLLVYVPAGTTIHLSNEPNSWIYNDVDKQTTFSGFLLMQTNTPM